MAVQIFFSPLSHNMYEKIAFLIGGIGITPVISIIEHICDKKLSTDVALLYSNRNEDEIAFKKELHNWQSQNKMKAGCKQK